MRLFRKKSDLTRSSSPKPATTLVERAVAALLSEIEQHRQRGLVECTLFVREFDVGHLPFATPHIVAALQEHGHSVLEASAPPGSYLLTLRVRSSASAQGSSSQPQHPAQHPSGSVPESVLDGLDEFGHIEFGERPNADPQDTYRRYVGPAFAVKQVDEDRLVREVAASAIARGGWHVYGGHRLVAETCGGECRHPAYLELIDRALIFLREAGYSSGHLSRYEMDRWVEVHNEHFDRVIALTPPAEGQGPPVRDLQQGESRHIATVDGRIESNRFYVEHDDHGSYVIVFDCLKSAGRPERERLVWTAQLNGEYQELRTATLVEAYRALGAHLRRPPYWSHDDLVPYFLERRLRHGEDESSEEIVAPVPATGGIDYPKSQAMAHPADDCAAPRSGRLQSQREGSAQAVAGPVPAAAGVVYVAEFRTSAGVFICDLLPDVAPLAVGSFVLLARSGFYKGLVFHRVVADFVIQTGCPEGTGVGGPGYTFSDEISDLPFKRGALVMANSGPNTNGSQFFVLTGDEAPWLDGTATIFGRVTAGMPTVLAIGAVSTDAGGRPLTPVDLEDVSITETKT